MVIFIDWIAFILLEQKTKPQSQRQVCENKNIWNVIIPSENNKILKFYQYQKSDKSPFVIYADFECIIKKIDGCKNNPKNSSITKIKDTYSIRFFNPCNIIISEHKK